MPRQKKPTPQELYRARKALEEKERNAFLPPGLVNHGNTCFMNSVLQGLIATDYLQRTVQSKQFPSALKSSADGLVASNLSPELTNGQATGAEHESSCIAGFPITDAFIRILLQAWRMRDNRERGSITPKAILSALGKKHEQYLDFRQQDAHEFLRQLLDAVRMEQVDMVKKPSRSQPAESQAPSEAVAEGSSSEGQDQPPIPSQVDNTPPPTESPSDPHESPISLIDMLFGGKLTSILVCQECKHISHTYEDFNDLSLSIKPEDYVRERKRDKLKQLARKLRHISGSALVAGPPVHRSSSVPATPSRDSILDSPDLSQSPRRRSIDFSQVEVSVDPVADEKPDTVENSSIVPLIPDSPITSGTQSAPLPPTSFIEPLDVPLQESFADPVDQTPVAEVAKPGSKEKRLKDDSWVKLSRRISSTMGLTKAPKDPVRNQKEDVKVKNGDSPKAPEKGPEELVSATTSPSAPLVATLPNSPRLNPERGLTSLNEILQTQFTIMKRSLNGGQKFSRSTPMPRFPLITRPSSPSSRSKRPKPCPPKLRGEEVAYLRDILADTNPHNLSRPFSFFRQSKEQAAATADALQHVSKLSQLAGIEDCLRLFTSVEVLDGENMVRCHRCWKIENGTYDYASKVYSNDSDSCCEDEDGDEEHLHERVAISQPLSLESQIPDTTKLEAGFVAPTPPDLSVIHPNTFLVDTSDTPSDVPVLLSSTETSRPLLPLLQVDDCATVHDTISPQQDPPIPLISMSGSESPQVTRPTVSRGSTMSSFVTQLSATSSKMSLVAPLDKHRRDKDDRVSDGVPESDGTSDRDTDAAYVYSDVSSGTSAASTSQEQLAPTSQLPRDTPARKKKKIMSVPRSKQVMMRPAHKRYLIASPPPILVIHLKRFQQMSKMPIGSFASGFKKLDDYISFPEYLDLAPFLAPKIEDYSDDKMKDLCGDRGRRGREDPCMYRLYGVVVHIGHMLGGHYVAYTALPNDVLDNDGAREDTRPSTPERVQRDWAYISDTVVRLASVEEVMKSKAYICMYERI